MLRSVPDCIGAKDRLHAMKTQLVSILVPAFNAERYIGDTIESCLAQTWKQKEIIVVNDGSRDGTATVASQFDPGIVKVVTQPNMGGCHARNRALSCAKGQYIQWLDADDLLHQDKISKQMEHAGDGETSTELLTSSYGTFFRDPAKAIFAPSSLWENLTPVEWLTRKFGDKLFSATIWLNPASWLVSRKLVDLAGPWDERLKKDQDGEYICRVVSNATFVKFVPDSISYYRIENAKSVSKNRSYESARSYVLASKISIDYLLSLENSERTRNASLIYLQNRYQVCYPDKKDLMAELNELAQKLGGSLHPPVERVFYKMLRSLFGDKIADFVKYKVRSVRTKLRSQMEYMS